MLAGSGKASVSNQVELVGVVDRVEEPSGGGLDRRDHRGDPLHTERTGGGPAEPGVFGLIQADHARLGLVPARQQDLLGFTDDRHQRRLGYRRRIGFGVAEGLLYRVVTGDDVVADRRGVEDGCSAAGVPGHDRVGIGEEFGGKRVEGLVDRASVSRAGRGHRVRAHGAHDSPGRFGCHLGIRGDPRRSVARAGPLVC